jgi:dynein heavy chain 1
MADSGDGDTTSAATPAQPVSVTDVSAFANYLRRVVPVLLENGDDTPEALVAALKDKSAVECMRKFLGDPQIPCLLVQRATSKGT